MAEGKAEAALERLGDDLGDPVRVRSRLDDQLRRLYQFGPVLLQHACALPTFGWFGVGFDGDAPTVGHNDEMAGSLPPSSLLDFPTGVAARRGASPPPRVPPGKRQTGRRLPRPPPLWGTRRPERRRPAAGE